MGPSFSTFGVSNRQSEPVVLHGSRNRARRNQNQLSSCSGSPRKLSLFVKMLCTNETKPTISTEEKEIEKKIGIYPDFPKKGVVFRDITPILNDPPLFTKLIDRLAYITTCIPHDVVLGIEARGFLIGPLIAQKIHKPFVPVRKKGKLPGEVHSVKYNLEYGHGTLEIQKSAIFPGSQCIVVDDLVATGGSMMATIQLVEKSGSKVVTCLSVIELRDFKARDKLDTIQLISLFNY